jgi:N-methylhydantoinase B
MSGWPGKFTLNPDTPDEQNIPPASEGISVKNGDILRIETGGGGGWGDPFTRSPEDVLRDVLEGYVTLDTALSEYGVALSEDGLEIDPPATETARSQPRPPRPDVDRGPHGQEWLSRLGVSS